MKLGFSSERRVLWYASEEKSSISQKLVGSISSHTTPVGLCAPLHCAVFSMNSGFSSDRRVQRYASEEKILNLRKLVGSSGLEPPTSRFSGVRSNHLSYEPVNACRSLSGGGDERVRTDDPLLAKQVLSQLSYTPISLWARSPL